MITKNKPTEHLIEHSEALKLIMGGKAVITVKNTQTQNRFTYKIKRMKTGDVRNQADRRNALRFISAFNGKNNETDYKYFGYFKILGSIDFFGNAASFEYHYSNDKAKISRDSQSVKVFEWLITHLRNNTLPQFIEIWHSGHCCRCGHLLTDPDSIKRGIGPECVKIYNKH